MKMGKAVEEMTRKKKKGRPSLLDLQKRNLREQQLNQTTPDKNPSPNYKSATTTRRSTRRNPIPDGEENEEGVSDEESERKKRRERKLKLVLKLPSSTSQKLRSSSPNSGSDRSDSNAEEVDDEASDRKRRKINPIGDGSDAARGENHVSGANPTSNQQGAQMDLGPSTPLPDKKLLLFILDRLQKKDTYSVFSEPVDPKELPDYHEIIEHPMDFSTVRKKLSGGAYVTLEHFEEDIFLICSNAMQYNPPNSVFFRQARSIQELAIKNFESLRQGSDDNEPERRVVRRGRPPTKHLKKPLGRPPLNRTGPESSDASLATGRENNILVNSGFAHSSHNRDLNWLTEIKFDKNDELSGSVLKGNSLKLGKKQFVLDENKRQTYMQFHPSAGGQEPSVLATFGLERKQLMAVGLHSEEGYARSLARFAASLGPVAWRIASKRIEKALSAGTKFGPGWVGENDILPQRPLVSSTPMHHPVESEEDMLLEKHRTSPSLPKTVPVANHSPEPITVKSEAITGPGTLNGMRPRPSFLVQQGPQTRPGTNGISGAYGSNLPAQMTRPTGVSNVDSEEPKHVDSRSKVKPGSDQLPDSGSEVLSSPRSGREGSLNQQKLELSQKQKQGLVPPDLNISFQSPGSPASSRVDKMQPDLALQL